VRDAACPISTRGGGGPGFRLPSSAFFTRLAAPAAAAFAEPEPPPLSVQ